MSPRATGFNLCPLRQDCELSPVCSKPHQLARTGVNCHGISNYSAGAACTIGAAEMACSASDA